MVSLLGRRLAAKLLGRRRLLPSLPRPQRAQPPVPSADAPLGWSPGHYYSPIPSLREVAARRATIFDTPADLPGIDLNVDGQRDLLVRFKAYYEDQPFADTPQPGLRYYFDNDYFRHGEATTYYCFLRHLRPERVIEVGSGFSSAVLLDVNERYLHESVRCTFIDPFPERLLRLLSREDMDSDRIYLLRSAVQDVSVETFNELQSGDILFIDSSHVSKVGSDVNYIVFNILPRLRMGVYIHIHDIYYPFEYPEAWVMQGRSWNESYILRAFMQYNRAFEIMFFNSYLHTIHNDLLREHVPIMADHCGSSLWLRRRTDPGTYR